MGIDYEPVVISGYTCPGMVEKLKEAEWTPCDQNGKNFNGIGLGDWCLTDSPDELCPTQYLITVEEKGQDEVFNVSGYASLYVLRDIQKEDCKNNLCGEHLKAETREGEVLYTLTVQAFVSVPKLDSRWLMH